MKSNKINIKQWGVFGIICIALSVPGCKKFVQVPPPETLITTPNVFNSAASATSAQMGIYVQMFQNNASYGLVQFTGLAGDEFQNYSTSGSSQQQAYTNAVTAVNGGPQWASIYKYIYVANNIIEQLKDNKSISAKVANQLTGESKFVRAWWYFYLTNLYGDVPLVTTTDYTVNKSMPRIAQAQVYDQIIADLKDAQGLLNANYVDATDTVATIDRIRPNAAAATALLARAYLYTKKYPEAEAQASLVIANSKYSLCSNLTVNDGTNYVFQANSSEAIWQLAPALPSTSYVSETASLVLKSAPSTGSTNCQTISPQLLSSFELNDKRKAAWIGGYPASSPQYYYPYKYQYIGTTTITSLANAPEYLMMLRLAEQYLIRAEARVQQGNFSGGLQDLNIIRHRAGLADYSGPTSATSVLTAILHERQVEFFSEWCHRWFDLKRTGTIDAVMGGGTGVCQAKGGVWKSESQLFPIPQIEISNNSNLIQNPGY